MLFLRKMVVVLAIFAFSTPVFAGYNMAFCSVCDNGDIVTTTECRGSGQSCATASSNCESDDTTCKDPEM
jgi:hypothetical protein